MNDTRELHVGLGTTERDRRLIGFVFDRHGDQVDKTGHPYQNHLYRVALTVPAYLGLVAYAHDVLEDTETTTNDLIDAGFTDREVAIIERLTHHPYERNYDYLVRLRADSHAVRVKLADLMDNISGDRMDGLDHNTRLRLRQKYYSALLVLTGLEV